MKSMVTNRTKTEMGRVTISLGELEALTVAEDMRLKNLDRTVFYKHLEKSIIKLNEFTEYNSAWVETNSTGEKL